MIISIQGEITQDTQRDVQRQLQGVTEPIELHIDSIGGDLFAGLAIYNMLQSHDVEVFIDGIAGSVASVIALSGKNAPQISKTGSIVIHNAHADNIKGNQHDVQKVANSLAKYSEIVASVYEAKTKLKMEDIVALMDNETTFNSKDAIETGFAKSVYNRINIFSKINNIDMTLLERIKNQLNGEVLPAIENVDEPQVEETAPSGEPFSPEQVDAIRSIVEEVLAGSMENIATVEEVGNTVATILNSITSKGVAPTSARVFETTPNKVESGVTSFYKKMNEIKNKTSKK